MKTAVMFPGLHGLDRLRWQPLATLEQSQHPPPGLLLDPRDRGLGRSAASEAAGQEGRVKPDALLGYAEQPNPIPQYC